MKRLLTCAAALSAGLVLWSQSPAPNPVLQAMRDEAQRSRKISIPGLEPPYFVQYVIDESDSFSASATLGGLVTQRRRRFRSPETQVRVGDYKFDNTNFAAMGMGGSRYDLGNFPIENAYPVLRRFFWLQTDAAYKAAVETISRKRAALRNITQSDQLNDFARAEAVRHITPLSPLTIDEDVWARRVRALSAVFTQFPEIKNSSVELEASKGGYYVVNSEGTEVSEPEDVTTLRVRAIAQAADGMTVRDSVTFHAFDPGSMPPESEMARGIADMARNLTAMAHAPTGEDYSGPVLFEGVAGAQILAEVLGKNLAPTRRPVTERAGAFTGTELEGRLGARVLPESFEVVDDPTQKEWRGRPLFGSYAVDREGVIPKPLRLVEKGVLKSYLLTRQPVRGFEGSNGRARMPGSYGAAAASISNLFVSSSESVPVSELKKKLIELVQARSKPYGILVRKMDFPSIASVDEARRMIGAAQGSRPVSAPVLIYKVFPDGREEMVRGLQFRGLNARSLRDILAAGDDSQTFEFQNNLAPFSLVGATGFTTQTCVVAPSILIDDLELHPVEEELPKLPLAPAPEFSR